MILGRRKEGLVIVIGRCAIARIPKTCVLRNSENAESPLMPPLAAWRLNRSSGYLGGIASRICAFRTGLRSSRTEASHGNLADHD